ncbi:MAG TPA: hypothetical protein VK163_02940 [Opitutaceae bacterium]|nr:hypothetical protein [Opitutaceae bacterium]
MLAEEADFALAEVERGLDGFGETRLRAGLEGDAVLDHKKGGGGGRERGCRCIAARARGATVGRQQIVDTVQCAGAIGTGHEDALVGLALEILENLAPLEIFRTRDAEGDEHGRPGGLRGGLGPDRLRVVVLDALAGRGVVARGDMAEPHFEVVGELGHRADGRARGLHGVALLDRDRRADVLDRVDLRLGEQLEELARVGAERLDVAPLPLGVERLEHERGFPRAAQSGDDDVPPEWNIEIEALEVVLTDAAEADGFERCHVRSAEG